MLQNATVTAFIVSVLFMENEQWVKLPLTQIMVEKINATWLEAIEENIVGAFLLILQSGISE